MLKFNANEQSSTIILNDSYIYIFLNILLRRKSLFTLRNAYYFYHKEIVLLQHTISFLYV